MRLTITVAGMAGTGCVTLATFIQNVLLKHGVRPVFDVSEGPVSPERSDELVRSLVDSDVSVVIEVRQRSAAEDR